MSVTRLSRPPATGAAARARARETLWRLSAIAFAHPTAEQHAAIESGDFHDAFAQAWGDITGRAWLWPEPPGSFQTFEAAYIAAFLHGHKGKPIAALLGGEHEELLRGLSRPSFMLNVAGFYSHFGLKSSVEDEGRVDEPDHLAAMTEFMAVLCHLEAAACETGRDAGSPRRAQRDFLARYLAPLIDCVAGKLRRAGFDGLDPTINQTVQELAPFARQQIAELEALTGPYRDPDAPRPSSGEPMPQNLWG